MKLKTVLTISIVLIYVLIIGIIAKFAKQDYECSQRNSACYRFCLDDTEKYSDEFLLQEFNKSKSARELTINNNIQIFRGYPLCGGMEFAHPNDNITSENPPYRFYHGSVYINRKQYGFPRYCLEKFEFAIDGWKVLICNQDEQIHRIFHLIVFSISVILFGITLVAHIYFKELRDFYGKCAIPLVANLILSYILITCVDLYDFYYDYEEDEILFTTLKLSLIHTLLWITVMIVHSLFTFINFKNRTTPTFDFSTYAVFVAASVVVSGIILYPPFFKYGYRELYTACFIITILNTLFVIVTAFIVFAVSRHPTYFKQARFHHARKWFLITVALALIFLVTWIAKYITNYSHYKYLFYITVDSMMLLTAITVTLIFLGRKNIKSVVIENYISIKNVEKEMQ